MKKKTILYMIILIALAITIGFKVTDVVNGAKDGWNGTYNNRF